MLGFITRKASWKWSVQGKHIAFKDFVDIGEDLPLFKAFSKWINKGFNSLLSQENSPTSHCSWRFWGKGLSKDYFICGLLRHSSDSYGRSYPLLIMGTGILKGWEKSWYLVPLVCERTWLKMEYLATKKFLSLKDLKDDLSYLPVPQAAWNKYLQNSEALQDRISRSRKEKNIYSDIKNILTPFVEEPEKKELLVPLNSLGSFDEQFEIAVACHFLMEKQSIPIPHIVFIGGTFESSFLAVYEKALTSDDFVSLFTLIG